MSFTKGAIGNLINKYAAVLRKCCLLNLLATGLLLSGASGVLAAPETSPNSITNSEGLSAFITGTPPDWDVETGQLGSDISNINFSGTNGTTGGSKTSKTLYLNGKSLSGASVGRGIVVAEGYSLYLYGGGNATDATSYIKNFTASSEGVIIYNQGSLYINYSSQEENDFKNIIFTGNKIYESGGYTEGGVISNHTGEIKINNVTFDNNVIVSNTKGKGAAIYNKNNAEISNSTFIGNVSISYSTGRDEGGAIKTESGLDIINCIFKDNYSSYYGGAIAIQYGDTSKKVTISDSTFDGNESNSGGALGSKGVNLIFNGENTFKNNITSGGGGAIYLFQDSQIETTTTFSKNSTTYFSYNKATSGGAIRVKDDKSAIINFLENSITTFEFNEAYEHTGNNDGRGGAILNQKNGKIYFDLGSTVTFNKNIAQQKGAAIFNTAGCTFDIAGTSTFSGNKTAVWNSNKYIITEYTSSLEQKTYQKSQKTVKDENTYEVASNTGYGGAIYNSGTFNLSGNSRFISNQVGDKEHSFQGYGGAIYNDKDSQFNISGTIIFGVDENGNNAYNYMTVVNDTIYEQKNNDIYNKGSINVGDVAPNTQTEVILNSGYIGDNCSTLSVKANANLYLGSVSENSGTIEVSTDGKLEIQKDATLYLKKGSTNNVSGTVEIKSGGTLDVDSDINKNICSGSIVNNGTIDMATKDNTGKYITSDAVYSTITVSSLSGTGKLTIDVDLTDNGSTQATSSDKIEISSGANSDSLILSGINIVQGISEKTTTTLEKYVIFSNSTPNGLSYRLVQGSTEGRYTTTDGTNDYIFTLSKYNGQTGIIGALDLVVKEASKITLPDFIQGRKGVSVAEFQMAKDITLEESIGKTGNIGGERTEKVLSVVFNDYILTGASVSDNGVTVADGFTLNLKGSGTMNAFTTAVTVEKGGTANLEKISFSNNGTDIKNSGTINLDSIATSTTVVNNGILNLGGGEFDKAITGFDGTTNIKGIVKGSADIENKVFVSSENNATFTINATNLKNTVDNRGTLNLTGGTLSNDVSGAGKTNVTDNLTNNASITNAVNVSSGITLTNKESGKIVGVLTNAGSVISDASNLQGKVENTGSLELTSGTMRFDVSGAGTTTVTGVVSNSGTIEVSADGKLEIQKDATLYLKKDSTNNVSGTVEIKSSGTLDVDNDINKNTCSGSIVNNGTIDMATKDNTGKYITSDAVYSTITVSSLSGTGKLTIDVNLAGTTQATSSDKIEIGSDSNSGSLILSGINIVQGRLERTTTTLEKYVIFSNDSPNGLSYRLVQGSTEGKYTATDGTNNYIFTLSKDNTGKTGTIGALDLVVEAGSKITLPDFIQGRKGVSVAEFQMANDIALEESLGKTGNVGGERTEKELSVVFNEHTLTGASVSDNGVTVADGFTLNLKGSGTMKAFTTAITVEKGGTANLEKISFSNNGTDIKNSGIVSLDSIATSTTVVNDGILNLAGGEFDKAITGFDGTTNIKGTVKGSADIENKVSVSSNNNASLTINATNLKNTVDNRGTLNLTGGTLSKEVSGAGKTNVTTANLTNTASITNAVNVSSGITLTNKESGKIVGVLTNAGSVISDASNLQGKVENTGSLNLTAGTMRFDVSGTGTTTVSGVVSNEGTNSNSLTISTKGSLVNSGILSGTVTNEGTLASQISDLTGNVVNNGTFLMSGNLNKNIDGSGTTLLASAIAIVEGNTGITGTLNMNDATVEMRDKGENLNILTVGSLVGTGSLSIDADMSNGSSDQIKISGGASNKATVKVSSINVTKNGKSGTQKDFITYLSGVLDGIECQLGQDGTLTTVTDGYKYTFSLGSTGKLNVITEDGVVADFSSFISDVGTMSGVSTYSFGKNITVSEALGRTSSSSDRGGELTMALNGYALQSGNSCDGFVVGKGYTVNLNGPSGTVSGFGTAIEVEQGATLNVSGVSFKDNKTDIQNNGNLNLTGTNTVSLVNDGMLQLAGDNTLVKLSGSGTAINTGKVTVGASGLGNPLVNNNELVLGAGTLSKEISGSGSVEIIGDVKTAADVSLSAFSTKLSSGTLTVNGIAELGTVTFDKGSLALADKSTTVVADMKNFLNTDYSSSVGTNVIGISGALNLNLGGASYTASQYTMAKAALFGGSDEKAALNFLNGTLKLNDGDNLAVGGELKTSSTGGNTVTITKAPVVANDGTTTQAANLILTSVTDKYVQVVKEDKKMQSSSDNHQTGLDTINITPSNDNETLSFASKGLEVASGITQITLNISGNSTIAFTGGEEKIQSVVVMDGKQNPVITDIVIGAKGQLDFGINGNKSEQKGTVRNVTVNGKHNVEGNGVDSTDFTYTTLSIASIEGSQARSGVKKASLKATEVTVTSDGKEGGTAKASLASESTLNSSIVKVEGTGTSFAVKETSTVKASNVSVLNGGQVSLDGISSLEGKDILVQGAQASLDVKEESSVETETLSVSDGGAVNVISATLKVKDKGLRIGQGGTLFLDPVHFDAGTLADDNTLSGGLYVGDGTVALIGADDSFRSTLYNRLLKEDSPVSVTGTLEDYTVGTGQTVLGLGTPMKMTAGAKLIVDGTVKSDGSISSGDTLPSGTSYVYFGKDSLLAVDGNKVTQDAAISAASGTKAKIAENAKLYIANAVSGSSYYILAVDSIEGSAGWTGDNLIVDTDLLGAYFHYSGTDQGWVSIETKPEGDIYSGLDGELVKLLKNMADGGLIDTESDTMGIRFLSRATASEASGKYMAGDKKGAVKTIESAARIAMAGAVPQMTLMASETLSEAMGNRMNIANGYNTTILEQEFKTGLALWITPLWKNQAGWGMEAFKQNYGFNANIGGVALGADYSFSETLRAGLAFNIGGGYAKSSGDLASTENHMNFWGIGVYGGYNDGRLSVMGDASYTSTYNKLEQDLDARMQMKNLKADVRAAVWSLGIRGDYKFTFDALDITPHLGVRYMNISSQEYDIKSGGTVAKSDGIQQSFWSIPVGVTFGKDFKTASGWSVTPSVDFTVTPRFGDLKAYESVRFTGVPGDAGLHTQTRDYVTYKGTAGLGAKYGNIGLNLNYSYEAGSCTSGHGVNASFRWEF